MTAPSADFIAATQARHDAEGWFWLFEIQLATSAASDRWVLLASTDEDVEFQTFTYHAYPCELESVQSNLTGTLGETQLSVSNLHGLAAQYLRDYEGLVGRRVVARLVHEGMLTDPDDSFPIEFECVGSSVDHAAAALRLGQLDLNDLQFPRGRYHRGSCRFVYVEDGRGRCGNTTTVGSCDRTLDGANGCTAHGNDRRFGGFPSMPGTAA